MTPLTIEIQGRELSHAIALMLQCLRIPNANETELRIWRREIQPWRVALERLYLAGLSRGFDVPNMSQAADGIDAAGGDGMYQLN